VDELVLVRLWWDLYEPEKVKRSRTNGSMSQSNEVFIGVSTFTSEGSWSSSETLSARKVYTHVNANAKSGNLEQATWNVNCWIGEKELIGLTAERLLRLQNLFGKGALNAKKGTIRIKGKAKKSLAPTGTFPYSYFWRLRRRRHDGATVARSFGYWCGLRTHRRE